MNRTFQLTILPQQMSIVRLEPGSPIPVWASSGDLFSICRTADELSIVCETERVPAGCEHSDGWLVFKVDGPFDFSEVGVLATLAGCLADAHVSLFVFSTWDTDYILIRAADLDRAIGAFRSEGHTVRNLH